ncbi:MAG: DUF1800 family protein [Devosia sp.]
MLNEAFRLTRKLGFGLRPEEEIPEDFVGWAVAQLDHVPQPLGVPTVPLKDGGKPGDIAIGPWPDKYILPLDVLVANEVALKKGKEIADKKYANDGAKWAELMNGYQAKHFTLYWEILRRTHQPIYSRQPVFERFSYFWANHFTVAATNHAERVAGHYFDKAINANMPGSFADMLYDVTTHPAMQVFLDGPYSIGPKSRLGKQLRAQGQQADINENLGRELLELHSLSPAGGYTQDDIINVARILTGHGYTIELPDKFPDKERWKVFFPDRHEPGPKSVMGIDYEQGREALRQLTDFLAAHESTILHISRKLALHFIADEPTDNDVAFIANAWRTSGGKLPAIHRAVIERAAARIEARKFQMPEVWLYQMLRCSGSNLFNGWEQTGSDVEETLYDSYLRSPSALLEELGQSYWVVRQPNGYSDRRSDWVSPEYLDRRLRFAQLAFTAGKPPVDVASLIGRMDVSARTRALVQSVKTPVDQFVLLFCSSELTEA